MSLHKVVSAFNLQRNFQEEQLRTVAQFEHRSSYDAVQGMTIEVQKATEKKYENMDNILEILGACQRDIEKVRQNATKYRDKNNNLALKAQQEIRDARSSHPAETECNEEQKNNHPEPGDDRENE